MAATVFAIDDDRDFLDALTLTLQTADFAVEGFHDAQQFLSQIDASRAGCIISDLCMPQISGSQLQNALIARGIQLPIIFITGYGDVATCARVFRLGAVNFLEKPFSEQLLIDSTREAVDRNSRMRELDFERSIIRDRFDSLTQREKQIVELVVSDRPSKEIAQRLRISPRTVEHHREHVMRKMKAHSLHDLIIMSVMCGIHDLRLHGGCYP